MIEEGGVLMGYEGIKRCADVLLSAVLILLLAIPMVGIALCIAATSKGGVLFRQERVGRQGSFFVCYKFRTMYADAPSSCPSAALNDRDRWVTPVGAFLRKTSLDELPQLFNVLRGQMSLVGPRPLIPREQTVHEMRRRYGADRLRPGMTGLSQICGRDLVDDRRKAALDARYARRMSPREDARILWVTLWQVLRAKGVRE